MSMITQVRDLHGLAERLPLSAMPTAHAGDCPQTGQIPAKEFTQPFFEPRP